ncbi:HlyD family type I secretion periplasmic adaptor subunit [Erwinia phyllosphaerae]|uniref:HlyD family type I secretion periplasmic adaptor subunit n=1 Tax=Erwinia phyllosphaerae TaxID=2853256 RepID=UPI001FEE4810|nr:HlyD family type I secretion periplasmic adaptor subunit [Erwinia phyllosphaerae]MBV4366388.1 HlyD family type I secretion periplasmic adaptor subunit [Erwinia phyllosphaerae]
MMFSERADASPTFLPHNERTWLRTGWLTAIAGFFSFILWATFAPLDKGVATTGTVVVSGNRKAVQAFSTGIVEKLGVKEGDRVTAGQTLVRLRQQQVIARQQSLYGRYLSLLITQSRLLAEEADAEEPVLSAVLEKEKARPAVKALLELQRQLLQSRRRALTGEMAIARQSIAVLLSQREGLQQSTASKSQQLAALREQAATLKKLAAAGHLPRHAYLDVQRDYARVESEFLEMKGHVDQLRKQQQETELRMTQLLADRQKEIYTKLAENQQEITDSRHQLSIADIDIDNTLITAPVSGTVLGLTVFTEGGVVQAGEHLMAIVPDNEALIVEARLPVNLIDKVHPGLPVTLLFSAFNQNTTPKIPGELIMVSADSLTDSSTGAAFYPIQIAITVKGKALLARHHIRPGMTAEVFINTGSRSLMNYLFRPILDRVATAMTEE